MRQNVFAAGAGTLLWTLLKELTALHTRPYLRGRGYLVQTLPQQMFVICCHEMLFENLKCVKMRFRLGLRRGPHWGAYNATQAP